MRVIAGTARGTQLKTPEGMMTRPTTDRVKEALFSILHFQLAGARVLDLFGGTGQLGIEALSRGAKAVTVVDAREEACKVIRENYRRAKLEASARIIRSDYQVFLNRCREKYDIILLDPPYAENFLETAMKMIGESDILQSGGIIVAECPLGKELPDIPGLTRGKDYRYGKIALVLYHKQAQEEETT